MTICYTKIVYWHHHDVGQLTSTRLHYHSKWPGQSTDNSTDHTNTKLVSWVI